MRDILAGGAFGGFRDLLPTTAEQASAWAPAVDVFTRDNDVVVRAELSGLDPAKDVEISLHDGMLTIRGERRQEDRKETDQYVRLERRYGSFERSLPIPEGVNADDIKAEYRNGVLQVVIPGAAQISSVKKIPVQVANGSTAKTIEAQPSGGNEG